MAGHSIFDSTCKRAPNLSEAEYESYLEASLPLTPTIGYEFVIGHHLQCVRFRWSDNPPKNWAAVGLAANRYRLIFANSVRQHNY